LSNCCNTGQVEDDSDVGGLVGRTAGGYIGYFYSSGEVKGLNWNVGGLIGDNYDYGSLISTTAIHSCIWDVNTSGQGESDGGYGLTSLAMGSKEEYLARGWDFLDESTNGMPEIWRMPEWLVRRDHFRW